MFLFLNTVLLILLTDNSNSSNPLNKLSPVFQSPINYFTLLSSNLHRTVKTKEYFRLLTARIKCVMHA